MAAAPAFDLGALIDKLYGLISRQIVIDDKVKDVRKDVPAADATDAEITDIVTDRSTEQIRQAKGFMRYLIENYLHDGGRFVLSAKEAVGKHTFTPAIDGFNRIVLVDFENARNGLQGAQSIGIPHAYGAVNNYIYNLARSDTNALYILVRSVNPGNKGRFYKFAHNIVECNIDFHPPASDHGINYNETDDFVLLPLLKLLVDKQHEMFGQPMPVYVISADNYSWFTPKNVLQANLPHSQGRTYPYLVYYSPILGGQWCYYRSANTNTRKQIPVGRFTEHQNQGSRKNNSNRFYRSLGQGNYYNTEVFPAQANMGTFVSKAAIRPTHPIFGDICHLRKKVDAARAIPPGYEESMPGSDIFVNYTTKQFFKCTYNAATGEFNHPDCNTWNDEERKRFETEQLEQRGMTSAEFSRFFRELRNDKRKSIAAELEKERLEERARIEEQVRVAEQARLMNVAREKYKSAVEQYEHEYIQQLVFFNDDLDKLKKHGIKPYFGIYDDAFARILNKIIGIYREINTIKSEIDEEHNAELAEFITLIKEIIDEIQRFIAGMPSEIEVAEQEAAKSKAIKRKSSGPNNNNRGGPNNNMEPKTKKAAPNNQNNRGNNKNTKKNKQ